MIGDAFRRLLYPVVVATVVATVWVVSWSRSMKGDAERTYWPALMYNQASAQTFAH